MVKKHTFKMDERSDYLNINCHFWHGKILDPHYHDDYYEVIIMTKGEADNRIGEQIVHQKCGSAVIIRPMVIHGVDGTSEFEHFNIAVSRDRFERLLVGKDSVKNALLKNEYLTVSLNENEFDYLSDCIEKIDEECATPLSVTLAETVLSVIFLSIMCSEDTSQVSEFNIRYYCRDAAVKMDTGAASFKSVSDIYAVYPVSHTSFISEFKTITGKTPSEYLRESKLIRAKELLLNTSRSVLDIAYEVGYDSMSHFIKCFKARYGTTPLKFRKVRVSSDIKEAEYE